MTRRRICSCVQDAWLVRVDVPPASGSMQQDNNVDVVPSRHPCQH